MRQGEKKRTYSELTMEGIGDVFLGSRMEGDSPLQEGNDTSNSIRIASNQ
jgi:hypothetical protein